MKSGAILKISGLILALLLISAIIFLSFPGRMIHPEDFSPIAYMIAFLLALPAIGRLPKNERKWGYWLYAGLALFLGLEEISFGVENEWLSSIYVESLDLEIYDVHNIVPVSLRRLGAAWGIRHLSQTWLLRFLFFDLTLLAAVTIAPFVFSAFKESSKAQPSVGTPIAFLSGVISTWALISLASLPADPKNAIVMGYSLQRFVPMLGLGMLALAGLMIAMTTKRGGWFSQIEQRLKKSQRWLAGLAFFGLVIGIVIQFLLSVNLDTQKLVRLARTQPLLSWGMLQMGLLYLLAIMENEKALARWLARPKKMKVFVGSYPATIFAASSLGLVGFAQLLDKDWISIAALLEGSELWVNDWNHFIEEFFEAAGGILLAVGTFFFPRRK